MAQADSISEERHPGHWIGLHAPALRRFIVAVVLGLIVFALARRWLLWQLAVLFGWDTVVLTVLLVVWPLIATLASGQTAALATREDETRCTAAMLELRAATVSLVAVLFALQQASETEGSRKLILTTAAMLTILVAWVLVTTVFVLRYAHLHYTSQAGGVDFHADTQPDYLDFAYMAFTIGMTYQVSDTEVRDPSIRRAGLRQALRSEERRVGRGRR